jgi:hypothetical protein
VTVVTGTVVVLNDTVSAVVVLIIRVVSFILNVNVPAFTIVVVDITWPGIFAQEVNKTDKAEKEISIQRLIFKERYFFITGEIKKVLKLY